MRTGAWLWRRGCERVLCCHFLSEAWKSSVDHEEWGGDAGGFVRQENMCKYFWKEGVKSGNTEGWLVMQRGCLGAAAIRVDQNA